MARVGQVARASGRLECEVTSLGHSARLVAISKMSKHSSCLEISDEPDKPNKHDKTEKTNNLTELKLSSKGLRTKNII